MTTSGNKKFNIRSGEELITNPVPEIPYRILGLLRANGGRMSLTGPYKSEKSLLAQELAMKIAKGEDWLGFKTTQGNVLYINLEIAEEKLQERTQDFYQALGYDLSNVSHLSLTTILSKNLALDFSATTVQAILDECQADDFKVDVLFLDPRARLVAKSENEEVVIKALCDNTDTLLSDNPGLSVVIVTHMGKDPTKGAIGHSRFSGWLDTEIRINKSPKLICDKELEIIGRDIEKATLSLNFSYPRHYVAHVEEAIRKTKVEAGKEFIIAKLTGGEITEQQLRIEARAQRITDYAFHTAIRELKDEDKIEAIQSGQGNRKFLRLVSGGTHQ